MGKCKICDKCGGCNFQGIPYEEQLAIKQKNEIKLLGKFGRVNRIMGMDNPLHYRNKVHHAFGMDSRGTVISGIYELSSHRIVQCDDCMLEDEECQEIIKSVGALLRSFKIPVFNEKTCNGLLRHVLIRKGFTTGEIMVILVSASPLFPSKANFVKALVAKHPCISTVVLNINNKRTSMVLGDKNVVLFGSGFITDVLCGLKFRISPDSFYQVNPVQTEKLYKCAVNFAGLTGTETVVDAYCGIGTIGLTASSKADSVVGVELNKNAVSDAIRNAGENKIKNVRFYCEDAEKFLYSMAEAKKKCDVLFMDPPRSGSTETFLKSCLSVLPKKIVYISCNPETLKRDLEILTRHKYTVKYIQPVDMFPFTEHMETVVLMVRAQEKHFSPNKKENNNDYN